METMTERMNELQAGGWTSSLDAEEGGIRCDTCGQTTAPEDASVDQVFRFEGASDPDDLAALYALTPACGHQGLLVTHYGPGTPTETADVVTRLPRHQD